MDKILVIGKNGQLGQHLISLFLNKGFNVIGTKRHKSYEIQPLIYDESNIQTKLLDLCDSYSVETCLKEVKPDFIFNTGANAFVGDSWTVPSNHIQTNTIGVLNILESLKNVCPNAKFINMGTSEEFGCETNDGKTQNELTTINPKSPYGASKAAARFLVDIYRKSYNIFCLQPWAFNFESEIRGPQYVTRKISLGVSKIFHAIENKKSFEPILLGNLNSIRSWQYAGDVAEALWLVANQKGDIKPYVISGNEPHSIRDFVSFAFLTAGINGCFVGEGIEEKFISDKGDVLVAVSEQFFRPLDVTYLNGDSSAIKKELGWSPKTDFKGLVKKMVENDLKNERGQV